MSFRKFATDPKAKKEGRWFQFADGIEFKIASAKSNEFLNKIKALCKENNVHTEADLTEKIGEDKVVEMTIKSVLKDWRGIDEDGEVIEFSEEKIDNYLLHKEEGEYIFDEVIAWIINKSASVNSFRYIEEKVKN